MGFRRIFADNNRGYLKTSSEDISEECKLYFGRLNGNDEVFDIKGKEYTKSSLISALKNDNSFRKELCDNIIKEISKLRENVTKEDDLVKKITEIINNPNMSSDLLWVYSNLYVILYGKEAYKGILSAALRGNLEKNVQDLLVGIQDLNKSETLDGIERQLQNIQKIINGIPDKDIKSLMRKDKKTSSNSGKFKKSSLARTAADYKDIGKALVNGLVRATMNVVRKSENSGGDSEDRERILYSLYNMAGKYLSNSVLSSYKTVLANTLKQWNQSLPEKNEISKDTSLRDYSIRMLAMLKVFNVENYGLWMLHATEQFYKARGMSVRRLYPLGLEDYLNEQWESRYREDFKDLVANEAIRLLNEDYASNEDFANKWDGYKASLNKTELKKCIDSYVDDAYDSLGSQRMDEYYFGKKFKRIDGKKGSDIKNDLLKDVKEELTDSVLSN